MILKIKYITDNKKQEYYYYKFIYMKYIINRENILKPLQQITSIVERRQTMPILSHVLFNKGINGLQLTTTDLEVEIVAQVKNSTAPDEEITLPARKFLDICKSLPAEKELELETSENKTTLRSGRSRFSLAALLATEFPVFEDQEGTSSFTFEMATLKKLIERTAFSMAQQDVRYYLNGLLIEITPEKIRAVATDGHRLALAEADHKGGGEETVQAIIPRKGVLELARLLGEEEESAEIALSKNHLVAILSDYKLTSKLIDGKFPDYEKVIPTDGDKKIIVSVASLKEALQRAAILSNEKYRGVPFHCEDGKIKIQAQNPEKEDAEVELEADYGGEAVEVGFNVTYLLEALDAIEEKSAEITLKNGNSSAVVTGQGAEGSKYVIMPMRL